MAHFSWRRILANLRIGHLLLIVLLLAALIFLIATYSIKRNRAALLEVMSHQGESLIQALVLAGENIVASRALIEETVADQLTDLALNLDSWYNSGSLSEAKLTQVARRSGYLRIDILNQSGNVLLTSEPPADLSIYLGPDRKLLAGIQEVLNGQADSALLQLSSSSQLPDGGTLMIRKGKFKPVYILILTSARYLEELERQTGIGYLVQRMGQEPGIEFVAMQAPEGIVFASKNIEELYKIETDPFLQEALAKKQTKSRIARFQGKKLLEVVRPFQSTQYPEGIFRIGLSLDSYDQTVESFTRQTILVSVAIFLVGLLLVGFVMVNQNVRSLSEALQKTESLNLSILESMDSAVLAVDAAGNITTFNQLAEKLFSLSRQSVIGENYSKVFPKDEWLISQILEKKSKIKDFEVRFKTLAGEEKTLLVNSSGIFNQPGQMQGALAVIHDITELKRLEEESKRSERLSALGNLAAGVAHEIRNPLNAISIAAQRLKSEFKPTSAEEDYQNFLSNILSEIKRLDQIVIQFLSLARSQKLNLEPTDSAAYLSEILNLVKVEAEAKGIRVQSRLSDSATLKIDRPEMKKALLNIILNGMEAMQSGGTLTVETRHRTGADVLEIVISDTGKGIPAEDISKIFQPYFSTKEKGSGLGLAIAHRIVTDHKGKIEVKSEVGKGTSFVISLPMERGG
jgi:PAS domain S-box-containing protein